MTQNLEGEFREPTLDELKQLAEYLIVEEKFDPEEVDIEIEASYIIVLDGHTTFRPGYALKVMTVVWRSGGHPYNTFILSKQDDPEV